MDINYDKYKVKWEYRNKEYEYKINDVDEACMEKNYIYLVSYNSKDKKYIYTYITLDGLLIISYSMFSNKVTICDNSNKEFTKELSLPLQDLRLGKDNYIYIILSKDRISKIMKLSQHGEKMNEYICPDNYFIIRFFNNADNDKEIKVICGGPADQYGKDTWCLSLNSETGEWKVIYSMLDK